MRSALEHQQSSSEYHRRDAYQPLLKLAHLTRQASNPNDAMDLFVSQAIARTGVTQAALFLVLDQTVVLYKSEGFLSPPNTPPLQPIYNALKGEDKETALTWPGLQPAGPEPAGGICLPLVARDKIVALAILEHSSPN